MYSVHGGPFLLALVVLALLHVAPVSCGNYDELTAPSSFVAHFVTSVGTIPILVERDLSPRGADHFFTLIVNQYFNDCRFFRVVPNFVVQWGLNGDPDVTAAWSAIKLPDEPVIGSNTRGTIAYASAGPNTRNTQLYINWGDNSQQLDPMGFAPFGRVIDNGMDVVEDIYSLYGQNPKQGMIMQRGNEYLNEFFPLLDYIIRVDMEAVNALPRTPNTGTNDNAGAEQNVAPNVGTAAPTQQHMHEDNNNNNQEEDIAFNDPGEPHSSYGLAWVVVVIVGVALSALIVVKLLNSPKKETKLSYSKV